MGRGRETDSVWLLGNLSKREESFSFWLVFDLGKYIEEGERSIRGWQGKHPKENQKGFGNLFLRKEREAET